MDFVDVVTAMDPTISSDYTGTSFALIGGSEPVTVTRAIAATSVLCNSLVDADLSTFINTGEEACVSLFFFFFLFFRI